MSQEYKHTQPLPDQPQEHYTDQYLGLFLPVLGDIPELQFRLSSGLKEVFDAPLNESTRERSESLCQALLILSDGFYDTCDSARIADFSLTIATTISQLSKGFLESGFCPNQMYALTGKLLDLMENILQKPLKDRRSFLKIIDCLDSLSSVFMRESSIGEQLATPSHQQTRGDFVGFAKTQLLLTQEPSFTVPLGHQEAMEMQFELLNSVVKLATSLNLRELAQDYYRATARIYHMLPNEDDFYERIDDTYEVPDTVCEDQIPYLVESLFQNLIVGQASFSENTLKLSCSKGEHAFAETLAMILDSHPPEWIHWPYCLKAYMKISNETLHKAKCLLEDQLLEGIEVKDRKSVV